MYLRVMAIVGALLAVVLVLSASVTAMPTSDNWDSYRAANGMRPMGSRRALSLDNSIDDCEESEETRGLCQRCAKVTKSELAYPMCCESQEDVRGWCVKYLSFGIHK